MHKRVRTNLRHILGPAATDQSIEEAARASWRNYMRYLREFVSIPHFTLRDLDDIAANMEGWEHVHEVMKLGRGAVVVSAHFGNWDLAAAAGARFYPVNVIADTFNPPRLDELVNSFRKALGIRVIPIEVALRRTLSALRRGEAVAFLVDKPVKSDGVVVNFFGHPVQIPGGAAFFALKTKAPIVPAFVWRTADNRFAGKVLKPIVCEPTGDMQKDLREAMQRVMDAIEEMVRARPDYWYMFRSMWREEAAVA